MTEKSSNHDCAPLALAAAEQPFAAYGATPEINLPGVPPKDPGRPTGCNIDMTNVTKPVADRNQLSPKLADITAHLHALFDPALVHPHSHASIEIANDHLDKLRDTGTVVEMPKRKPARRIGLKVLVDLDSIDALYAALTSVGVVR